MKQATVLLGIMRGVDKEDRHPTTQTRRFATVDPNYSSGRPKVTFDGESVLSGKAYPYLASYKPAANDRVLMLKVGHSWVVVDKIV